MFDAVHVYYRWAKRLFFPNICFGCDRIGTSLCMPCERALLRSTARITCLWCDQIIPHGICRRHSKRFGIERIVACVPYAHATARKLIEGHKYDGIAGAAAIMAHHMMLHLDSLPFAPTRIVIIPSTLRRERSRGGSHLLALAKPISEKLHIPIDTSSIVRIRNTPTLVRAHSPQERRRILKNAFQVKNQLSNEHVLLIDDVVTSGSTLREVSQTLKRAGAKRIAALVFARA